MGKKGLMLAMGLLIVFLATMVEAQSPAYWQGYDLGYYHGSNHWQRAYPANAYHNDFLQGYDRGHVDGWYNWPKTDYYHDQPGYAQNGYGNGYGQREGSVSIGVGRVIINLPIPPMPPFSRRHHR